MTTIMLSRSDIAALMRPVDYIAAVEEGFRAAKEGRACSPAPLHLECPGGGFHAKAARFDGYAALKLNGNFPGNRPRGVPTIQGAILLCVAADGTMLAVMDSAEVTAWRTAAATAVAAKYLARPESSVAAIIGCGEQAGTQLAALRAVLPLDQCRVFDLDAARAEACALTAPIACEVASDVAAAARGADVIVTVTTSAEPILGVAHVAPGTFIAAVGADSPHKRELSAELMAASHIAVDVLEQCLAMGELRHAVASGLTSADVVRADLGDLVTGQARGRTDDAETWVFDSTGTALQDVAAAAIIYQRAMAAGSGTPFAFDR
jgi:ornithine cyclodeaminase/alanine dehydrogenase-like protein (mu-crystallin family)